LLFFMVCSCICGISFLQAGQTFLTASQSSRHGSSQGILLDPRSNFWARPRFPFLWNCDSSPHLANGTYWLEFLVPPFRPGFGSAILGHSAFFRRNFETPSSLSLALGMIFSTSRALRAQPARLLPPVHFCRVGRAFSGPPSFRGSNLGGRHSPSPVKLGWPACPIFFKRDPFFFKSAGSTLLTRTLRPLRLLFTKLLRPGRGSTQGPPAFPRLSRFCGRTQPPFFSSTGQMYERFYGGGPQF